MLRRVLFQFCLLIIFLSNAQYSQYLYVSDPQFWGSYQGTIEEAVVSLKPAGIYTEVGLYLTFSARDSYFNPDDSLEVVFSFPLPENSVVCDSWLWIGDDIIRGEIMDKWTASAIYEEIVDRRLDPSILIKTWGNNYELRIFPMLASETRKVKITYLVPADWSATNVNTPLPINLLQASYFQVPKLDLLTFHTEEWGDILIQEYPEIEFESFSDSTFGDYKKAVIPGEYIQGQVNFQADSPINNGIYLSTYENGGEGFYQLVYLPPKSLDVFNTTKTTILIDHESSNNQTVTPQDILSNLKTYFLSNYDGQDSINLIFSNLDITRASEVWVPADSASIEELFSNLGDDPVSNYSNLPSLLANGIEFVKSNGGDGNIVLIVCSDQVGEIEVANNLLEDLQELMDVTIPIYVADYQNNNYQYIWVGGRYYRGNEYFYTNLTRITSGNYFSYYSGNNFPGIISTTLDSQGGIISSFDLHTSLENGYCYGRYNLGNLYQSIYPNNAILQVGRFNGSFPFQIEVAGVYNSELFIQDRTIELIETEPADSMLKVAWAGNHIEYLEEQNQTNGVINEVIYFSLNNRVLSKYSAFLCLEPSMGGVICWNCLDETDLTGVETDSVSIETETNCTAYPNPFNNQVTIEVNLSAGIDNENVNFKIYNVLGQVVRNFSVDSYSSKRNHRLTWNGKDDSGRNVSSGIYFFIANTAKERYSLKLLHMK